MQEEFTESQRASESLKMYYEEKLRKQEDEHELEIIDTKENHKNDITALEKEWHDKEAEQEIKIEEKKIKEDECKVA